ICSRFVCGSLAGLGVPGLRAGARVLGVPDVVFAGGDLFDAAACDDGVGFGFGDGGVGGRALEVIVLFNEEPVWLGLRASGLAVHADERPLSLELRSVEDEFERAGAQAGVHVGIGGLRFPCSLVPKHDGAASVLALGDMPSKPPYSMGWSSTWTARRLSAVT